MYVPNARSYVSRLRKIEIDLKLFRCGDATGRSTKCIAYDFKKSGAGNIPSVLNFAYLMYTFVDA
jgi:hypothetical protein